MATSVLTSWSMGVQIESPEGVWRLEQILSVPGMGFAEMGPGDLSLALGYTYVPRDAYPPEMEEAREHVLQVCQMHGMAFPELCTPTT